jgi:hypothetical protein
MLMRGLLLGGFVALLPGVVGAHERWANNEPVPPWVKAICCGPEDVHHLRPDQVHVRPEGWQVDGYPDTIPIDQAMPSPDGDYWIFYKHFPAGDVSKVYCFFTPFNGA